MNLEGVALKLLLEESDKEKALQIYSELKPNYFSNSFATILTHIRAYYDQHGEIPSLDNLKVFRNRDTKAQVLFNSLDLIDTSNIDITLALEELANQHAQNSTLTLIDSLLDTLTVKDRYEILESISTLPMKLEELIDKSNIVFTISDCDIFESDESVEASKITSGISNAWDSQEGYFKQDLILLGGKRGSGKSVVCANLTANQHLQGKPTIYFTIEMTGKETFQRILCILASVDFSNLKKGRLSIDEKNAIGKSMARFYIGGEEVFNKYFDNNSNPDLQAFQTELRKLEEKSEGRIIIVDDRDLTVATVDTKIGSYKSRYGDELGLVVVDYLNQLVLEGTADMYDWKDQIVVSKTLKNLARKHDVCIVSPYQMDDDGKARFSKGILDACDVAQLILVEDKESGHIEFKTDKMRSGDDTGRHIVSINWKSLKIDPREVIIEEEAPPEEPKKKKKSDEGASDLELL